MKLRGKDALSFSLVCELGHAGDPASGTSLPLQCISIIYFHGRQLCPRIYCRPRWRPHRYNSVQTDWTLGCPPPGNGVIEVLRLVPFRQNPIHMFKVSLHHVQRVCHCKTFTSTGKCIQPTYRTIFHSDMTLIRLRQYC